MLREARAILNVHTTVTATGFGEISIPDVHWTCPCPPGACSGGCHCHCSKCASRVGGCPCPLICSTKACPCLCNKCFQSWNGAARERGRSEASEERKKGKAKDYSKTYRDKKLGDASSLGARASPMDISNLDSVARITRRERRGPASKGTEVGRGKGSHPPSHFPHSHKGPVDGQLGAHPASVAEEVGEEKRVGEVVVLLVGGMQTGQKLDEGLRGARRKWHGGGQGGVVEGLRVGHLLAEEKPRGEGDDKNHSLGSGQLDKRGEVGGEAEDAIEGAGDHPVSLTGLVDDVNN